MLRRQWRKGAPQRLCGHRAQPCPAEASWHPSTTLGYLRVGSSRQLSLCPVINPRQGGNQGWRESDTGKWTMWGKRKESGVISGGRIHTCGHEPGWHRYLRSVRGSRGEKDDEGRQREVCQELDLEKKKCRGKEETWSMDKFSIGLAAFPVSACSQSAEDSVLLGHAMTTRLPPHPSRWLY